MKRLLLLAAWSLAAAADPLSEARNAIQKRYDLADRAFEKGDANKASAYLSPDFSFTSAQGDRFTVKQLKTRTETMLKRCSKIRTGTKITRIQLTGKRATVQVQSHFEAQVPGFWPGSKTTHQSDEKAQDSWILTGNGWLQTSSSNLFSTSTRDGKKEQSQVGYLRVIREDGTPVSLEAEIASFRKGNQTVDLVAALHVGEHSYYQQLNQDFKSYDAILYELIAPENVRPQADEASDNALTDGQMLLTNMLGLKFQLHEIDYSARNFVHADLTPEQLYASMDKRGESAKQMIFQMLQESLGSSTDIDPADALALNVALPRIMIKGARPGDRALLRRVFAQSFQKIEKVTAALSGPNGSTLINVRNQKALQVAERELARGRKRLAIFYGAGHMVDLEARLKKLGFQPQSVRYLKAWDLREPKT